MKKLLQKIYGVALLLITSVTLNAQNVGINATGAAPSGDAMLDVAATNKGLLVPRVNIPNLNAIAPITGGTTTSLLVYNTNATTGLGYYYWDGAKWVQFTTGGDDWKIIGNANTTSGTNFLGTTNAQALDFRTGNLLRFRVANAYQVHAMNLGTTALPFYSFGADPNTGMWSSTADFLNFSTAAIERLELGTTEAVFNDISANYDFRIESDLRTNMFFVDGGNNRIGINQATPTTQWDYLHDGTAGWSSQWVNNTATGGTKLINHTSTANGSRVMLATTNYNASALQAAAVVGLSLNATTTGNGGTGVLGAANNESGVAVYGSLSFVGAYSGWAGFFNADVGCVGTYIGSDRRLKRDIKPISNALDIISNVEPVSYYYDTEKYPGIGFDENRLSYGFIAQDLEQIIPEMVKDKNLYLNSTNQKTSGTEQPMDAQLFKVVNYTLMIPILTEGIKEQQLMIEAQNAKIEVLEKMVLELKNK